MQNSQMLFKPKTLIQNLVHPTGKTPKPKLSSLVSAVQCKWMVQTSIQEKLNSLSTDARLNTREPALQDKSQLSTYILRLGDTCEVQNVHNLDREGRWFD